MAQNQHKVAAALRQYAEKIAAEKAAAGEGAPDRMTVADGQGGITASKGSVPHDVGEDELKRDQPADGTMRTAAKVPSGGPDRLTVADGQGGITTSKGSIPTDPGEEELKRDQPADGETRKAAGLSRRAANIRAALCKANPEFAAKISKSAGNAIESAPRPQAQQSSQVAPLDLSVNTLAKIASAILSTDEGVRYAHYVMEKQAGEDAARAQIQEAIQAAQIMDQGEQVKSAAFDDLREKVVGIHDALCASGVTEADADAILKQAAYHQEKIASFDHPLLKQAYAQGMDDAALMTAADDAAGEEGVPPVEEAMPMGGEDLSEEEIVALLQEMLASGEITEEDILQAVSAAGGGEGGAAPGGDAGGAPAGPPAEEVAA